MEVHHHPKAEKKNFKEYFLEFLMIFLAVTMGFIAENIREKITENRQEHEYMQSMFNDLQNDLSQYKESIGVNNEYKKMIDTLIVSISQHKNNLDQIYFDARKLTMGSAVLTQDSKTFEEMKSGNGFRLIKKRKLADSIAAYYQLQKKFEYWSDLQQYRIVDIISVSDKLFSATQFFSIVKQIDDQNIKTTPTLSNPALLSNDPAVINLVLMRYQYYYGLFHLMNQRCLSAYEQASRLIAQIKQEYRFDN